MVATHSQPSPLARQLGYAGLAPFVLLATLLWIVRVEQQSGVMMALLSYAALIASFLGGLHWGIAGKLAAREAGFHYAWGVAPSLLGWAAILVSARAGLLLAALTLAACYAVDLRTYPRVGWHDWLGMRLTLTVVATLSCVLGAVSLFAVV